MIHWKNEYNWNSLITIRVCWFIQEYITALNRHWVIVRLIFFHMYSHPKYWVLLTVPSYNAVLLDGLSYFPTQDALEYWSIWFPHVEGAQAGRMAIAFFWPFGSGDGANLQHHYWCLWLSQRLTMTNWAKVDFQAMLMQCSWSLKLQNTFQSNYLKSISYVAICDSHHREVLLDVVWLLHCKRCRGTVVHVVVLQPWWSIWWLWWISGD